MKQLIFNCFIAGVWVKMREFYSVRVFVYVTVYIIHLLPYILEYLQVDSLVPLQIASKVEKRMAFAFPVFSMERLAGVRSIFSAKSPSEIFRFAIITSKFTIIGIG